KVSASNRQNSKAEFCIIPDTHKGKNIVTAFLILLAASVVVVSTMVLFPLIDLAFEKRVELGIRQHDDPTLYDESWRTGQPWLVLRANFLRQLMSALPHAQRRHLTLVHDSDQFTESRHRTLLIKRANTGTQTDTDLIAPDKKARPNQASTPSNAA